MPDDCRPAFTSFAVFDKALVLWHSWDTFVQRTLHMTQRKSSEERVHSRAIGRRIRSLRGDSSQLDFASMFGITRSTLANYELGRSRPPNDLLVKIAEKSGLSRDYFDSGPELRDFEDELKSLVGDGKKLTDDEWAIVRVLRVSLPEHVKETVQTILHGFERNRAALQLGDPETVVIDLARLYAISLGHSSYQRGVSGASIVQMARNLAESIQSKSDTDQKP
jgi:transcriptional regulator with XRE-family HTH domain